MSLIHDVATVLGNGLAKQTKEDESKAQIYAYVFERFVNLFLFFMILLISSYFLGLTKLSFIFVLTFFALRSRFGGAHVKKDYLCLLISVIIPLVAAYASSFFNFNYMAIIIVYILAFLIAFKVGVVDNSVKRLTVSEKAKFKREGIILLCITLALHITVLCYNNIEMSNVMTWAVIVAFVNLFLGD